MSGRTNVCRALNEVRKDSIYVSWTSLVAREQPFPNSEDCRHFANDDPTYDTNNIQLGIFGSAHQKIDITGTAFFKFCHPNQAHGVFGIRFSQPKNYGSSMINLHLVCEESVSFQPFSSPSTIEPSAYLQTEVNLQLSQDAFVEYACIRSQLSDISLILSIS